MLGMPVLSGFGQRIKDPSCKARRRNPPSSSHFSARPSSLIAMVESHTKDACFEQLNGFGERGICVAAVWTHMIGPLASPFYFSLVSRPFQTGFGIHPSETCVGTGAMWLYFSLIASCIAVYMGQCEWIFRVLTTKSVSSSISYFLKFPSVASTYLKALYYIYTKTHIYKAPEPRAVGHCWSLSMDCELSSEWKMGRRWVGGYPWEWGSQGECGQPMGFFHSSHVWSQVGILPMRAIIYWSPTHGLQPRFPPRSTRILQVAIFSWNNRRWYKLYAVNIHI